jgi:opacity protein-like surface antigen
MIFTLLLSSFFANAQDNLLNMLADDNEPIYVSYFFKGTKVVNGQSVELPAKGVFQFNIQHRFGALNSGLYNLYGLDFSQVRLSFDYGIKDWLAVSIGRSSSLKTIDVNSKIKLRRQVRNGFPLTIVANSAIYLKQWQYAEAQKEGFLLANQISYANQILFARKISRDLTLQLSPTMVHYNLVEIQDESNDKYAIGFGGRQKLTKRISVNAEYFYQLNDKRNNNVLSLGFDIQTGGHVFQLHLSNSPAMIDPEFITQTTGEWLQGDIYFGFNISRVFTLNK